MYGYLTVLMGVGDAVGTVEVVAVDDDGGALLNSSWT